ncbi:MAG: energy transducer TonB [Gammaproteobacteria bacterium]|nr:energy transducer TonB [Gammaproteobacteria bacterium]
MAAVIDNGWLEAPEEESRERLRFATFLAILLHAVLILGVTFQFFDRSTASQTLEVTLAQHQSAVAPDKADYLAQFDQEGSGILEEKQLITSPEQSPFHDTKVQSTSEVQIEASRKQRDNSSQEMLASPSEKAVLTIEEQPTPEETPVKNQLDRALLQRSLEIATLEARLDELQQIHANRPRIKRLTSLSTKSSVDAYYLNSWRRKIETIGNLNYPDEARRQKVYGSLRLLVAITPDGNVQEVKVLESSGHPVLDDAAVRIVRLAAPYAPFPDELRRTTDLLEIIRTWQFRKNSSLGSF